MAREILHCDLNGFYASCECQQKPEYWSIPLAVGGDAEKRHGIILAKNELAKKAGVKTGEALWQARQKCPSLTIVPPNFPLYLQYSKLARNIFSAYTPQHEAFGIDESWLDVTGTGRSGCEIAEELRQRFKDELGLTVSIGVSWNKIFAKLGSDLKKPDAVTCITQENFRDVVWPLPAMDLLYVGRQRGAKLQRHGIRTIGDIARAEPTTMKQRFGKVGLVLYSFANGWDTAPVASSHDPEVIKSIGNSQTTARDMENIRDVQVIMTVLAESVAARLREGGFLCSGVQITLRDCDLHAFERQCHLPSPTAITKEILDAAMGLVRQHYTFHKPLRSVGVRGIDLVATEAYPQDSLFDDEKRRTRLLHLEYAKDDIRRRFGPYSLQYGLPMTDRKLGHYAPKEDNTIHPVSYF